MKFVFLNTRMDPFPSSPRLHKTTSPPLPTHLHHRTPRDHRSPTSRRRRDPKVFHLGVQETICRRPNHRTVPWRAHWTPREYNGWRRFRKQAESGLLRACSNHEHVLGGRGWGHTHSVSDPNPGVPRVQHEDPSFSRKEFYQNFVIPLT